MCVCVCVHMCVCAHTRFREIRLYESLNFNQNWEEDEKTLDSGNLTLFGVINKNLFD